MTACPAEVMRQAAAVLRAAETARRFGRAEITRSAMHPDVRAALARLLEQAARHWDAGYLCCEGPACSEVVAPALAVARAVLGEEAGR